MESIDVLVVVLRSLFSNALIISNKSSSLLIIVRYYTQPIFICLQICR